MVQNERNAQNENNERTLSIIKPDAVGNNQIGEIIALFEKNGLRVIAAKMVHLTLDQGKEFYKVHEGKPFYPPLVSFISSGPVLVMILEGEDAVLKNREVMGATDPAKALPGTIRKEFAKSIDENCVHGSDSQENAALEIAFFFKENEICKRTR